MSASRIQALDGVRGVAVLLVLSAHVGPGYVRYGGLVGVTLFFVLSGYLITGVLLAERDHSGAIDWRAFYVRRALRLLPALGLLLAVLPALMWVVDDPRLPGYPLDALIAATYVSDFVQGSGVSLGLLDHTWSLAVEEQFYLLWPAVIALLVARARSAESVVRTVTLLAALAMGWRLVAAAIFDFDRVYFAPDTNAFGLLLGCALAARDRTASPGRARPGVVWAALLGLGALSIIPSVDVTTDQTALEFLAPAAGGLGLLLVMAARAADHWWLTLPVLTWFGRISYGLYLWHVPLVFLQPDGQVLGDVERVLAGGVAVVAAWVSWVLVEQRALRFKRRFERAAVAEVRQPA